MMLRCQVRYKLVVAQVPPVIRFSCVPHPRDEGVRPMDLTNVLEDTTCLNNFRDQRNIQIYLLYDATPPAFELTKIIFYKHTWFEVLLRFVRWESFGKPPLQWASWIASDDHGDLSPTNDL